MNDYSFTENEDVSGSQKFCSMGHDPLVFARAVHDLKNPVHAIDCCLDLLKDSLADELEKDLELGDIMNAAKVSTDYLSNLIARIVDFEFMSNEAGLIELTRLNLLPLLDEVIVLNKPSASKKNIQIVTSISGEPGDALAEVSASKAVFDNLLSNAIKHAPAGGKVEISYRTEASAVTISVRDTGPGIPESEHHMMFEPFKKLSTSHVLDISGAGLGLNIVKNLMEAQMGQVRFQNHVDGGAKFTLEFMRVSCR